MNNTNAMPCGSQHFSSQWSVFEHHNVLNIYKDYSVTHTSYRITQSSIYESMISDKRVKDTVKSVLKDKLSEMGVLTGEQSQSDTGGLSPALHYMATGGLTFEQQREMLVLQLDHDKLKQRAEIEKQLAVERLRVQTEEAKLALQQCRLDLIRSGKVSLRPGSDRSHLMFWVIYGCYQSLMKETRRRFSL